ALAPSTSVLIDGPGATQLTISGERKYRVLEIGDRTPDQVFGLAGVTIANGRLGADVGGGVDFAFQPSALAIDAVAFEDDFAFGGGGALDAQYSRTVEVDSSSFSSTVARTGSGGALIDGTVATFRNCTFGQTGGPVLQLIATSGHTTRARLL